MSIPVRLEFELDAEVYPELHAALSTLRNARARSERMRQLAAAGLVWEKVRLHGTAAAGAPAVAAANERPDLVTRADVNPQPPSSNLPLPPLERRATKRTRASTDISTAEKPRDAEFIDLAINAEPSPVPPTRTERRSPRPSRQDVEQAIRELPVLRDVVMDVGAETMVKVVPDVRPSAEHDDETHTDELEAPAPWASMNSYPDDLSPTLRAHHRTDNVDSTDDDTLDMPDATLHVTALSHKPATRSRLMRMKERGLFKNG